MEKIGNILLGEEYDSFSRILLFLSEVYLGYQFWLVMQYFNTQIYWSILKIAAGSVIAYVGVLGYVIPIILLYIHPLRRIVSRFRNVLRILTSLILIVSLIHNDIVRFALLFIAIIALTYSTVGVYELGNSDDISIQRFDRFIKGTLYGLFLLPVLRNIGFRGLHPFQYHTASNIIHAIIAFVSISVILFFERKENFKQRKNQTLENSTASISNERKQFHIGTEFVFAIANGVTFGLISHLNFWLFTTFDFIPRWSYVNPFPIDILIMFVFFVAVIFIHTINYSHFIAWPIFLIGNALFCHTSEGGAIFGALLLLISMPFFWLTSSQEIYETSPKLRVTSFVFGFLMYIICLFCDLALLAGNKRVHNYNPGRDVPAFGGIGQKPHYLLWFTVIFCGSSLIINNFRKYNDSKSLKEIFLSKFKKPKREHFYGIFLLFVLAIISIITNGVQHRINYRGNVWTDRLAVFDWNILQGYDLNGNVNFNKLVDVIKTYQPDVIALQETNSLHQLAGSQDIMSYLSEKLLLRSYQGAPASKYADGSSLLSAYEMKNIQYEMLPTPETRWARVLASCVVNFNKTDVTVASVHLESVLLSNRIAQVKFISNWIRQITTPLILMGDFNSAPNTTAIDIILEAGMTMANINPPERTLDYIFYRGLRLTLFEEVEISASNGASDHPALKAHFRTL